MPVLAAFSTWRMPPGLALTLSCRPSSAVDAQYPRPQLLTPRGLWCYGDVMTNTNTATINRHSPGNFDPADYSYVGAFYQGYSEDFQHAYDPEHQELAARLGEDWADQVTTHRNGGCTSCGAHFDHGVVVRHATGELITIGHTCGEAFNLPDLAAKARRKAERAAAAAAKRRELAETRARVIASHAIGWALTLDHYILRDIARSDWPPTPRQAELVEKIMWDVLAERMSTPDESDEPAPTPVPVTGDRVEVTGKIVSIKERVNDYSGYTEWKMVVVDDRGFRVWGTLPSSIDDAEIGQRVAFSAKIQRSDGDETFGFFKRPTKARCV